MKKITLILRFEIITILKSKVYLFFAFVLPVLMTAIFTFISLRGRYTQSQEIQEIPQQERNEEQVYSEGYVDLAGLVQTLPSWLPAGALQSYPDEFSAQKALASQEISAYYVIPVDYIRTGDLVYINPDYRFMSNEHNQSGFMQGVIFENLLGNDPGRIQRVNQGMDLELVAFVPQETPQESQGENNWIIPYATMMLMYMVLLISSSLLLTSVLTERKNRVIEILLVSSSARQLLTGKIIGLSLLGFAQAVVWLGMGYLSLKVRSQSIGLPAGMDYPVSLLVWAIVFFLLGNAFYAALMAGLGALAPNPGEANQLIFLVIWPLFVPILFYPIIINTPNSILAVILSLIPFTSPIAMLTRMVSTTIPFWQPLLAAFLLALSAVWVVRQVARLFHSGTLLSSQPLNFRKIRSNLEPK